MTGLLLNALLGLGLGRFGSVWWLLAFLLIVTAEIAYSVYVHHSPPAATCAALLVCR